MKKKENGLKRTHAAFINDAEENTNNQVLDQEWVPEDKL